MGGENNVVKSCNFCDRMISSKGLFGINVYADTAKLTFKYSISDRFLIADSAASYVYKNSIIFSSLQCARD